MTVLSIQNLDFAYDAKTPIFQGLNLEFLDTTSTAIIGQNGAGKTTLVKLIKGLLKASGGTIIYQGENVSTMSVGNLAKYVGLVFQNPDDQIFKSNVLEEVMFGPLNIGIDEALAKKSSLDALEKVGLRHADQANPYDLNLADRKMIAIASILAMDTPIVIFDEPTIAQDHQGKKRIAEIIRDLKEKGKLVITIIHDMDFVAENFERTIILAKGEKLIDAPTKVAFKAQQALEQAHLDKPHIMEIAENLGVTEPILNVTELVTFINNKRKK